jgi:trimethylamine--corrinoid protein Co-methyltransferase
MSILLNALSGSNLVHDVGWTSSAQATSNELLVLGDEMIGYTKRYISGIDTGSMEDSIQELSEVGPGGTFLDRDMTLDLFKTEIWYPGIMQRVAHKAWMDSEKTSLRQRLKNEVDRIVKEHQPTPIPEETKRQVSEMIESYEAGLGK